MAGVAIKISEEVAELVRRAAAASDRSMAGQVEHWARLAMEVEDLATVTEVNAIKQGMARSDGNPGADEDAGLRQRIARIVTEFRQTPSETLRRQIGIDRKTVYEPDPDDPGSVIRIAPDGTRTKGRFSGRTFVPAAP